MQLRTKLTMRQIKTCPTLRTAVNPLFVMKRKKQLKLLLVKHTTITEGTDGTYKTYKVDVDAPDYQLVENSSAADKAYTVSGNKVDLTVQDAKNPANKKTVTIKDIASKTELDDTKTGLIK